MSEGSTILKVLRVVLGIAVIALFVVVADNIRLEKQLAADAEKRLDEETTKLMDQAKMASMPFLSSQFVLHGMKQAVKEDLTLGKSPSAKLLEEINSEITRAEGFLEQAEETYQTIEKQPKAKKLADQSILTESLVDWRSAAEAFRKEIETVRKLLKDLERQDALPDPRSAQSNFQPAEVFHV